MSLGVDYASVDDNAAPSFAKASTWGVRFAIMRGAYTSNNVAESDPTLARDAGPARAAGLQVGAYLILGWHTDPQAQVAKLIAAYSAVQSGDFPPSLDIEGIPTGFAQADALARIEAALAAMQAHYGTVMIYTSVTVWHDELGNPASAACGACPLWLKVGYPWNARNPPHPDDIPAPTPVPRPWTVAGSPGAFVEQFQGDAIDVPGFSSTVDLDTFLNYSASASDPRTAWVRAQLTAAGFPNGATVDTLASAIRAFQAAHNLTVDGVIGPMSWAALCTKPS